MKRRNFILVLAIYLFESCAGQQKQVIFIPNPSDKEERPYQHELWQIIESQNGNGEAAVPEWVCLYFDAKSFGNELEKIESLEQFSGKYVFIGENRGNNFTALKQWANGYTAAQDLPRLVALRVERRFIAAASLYPDDEYRRSPRTRRRGSRHPS